MLTLGATLWFRHFVKHHYTSVLRDPDPACKYERQQAVLGGTRDVSRIFCRTVFLLCTAKVRDAGPVEGRPAQQRPPRRLNFYTSALSRCHAVTLYASLPERRVSFGLVRGLTHRLVISGNAVCRRPCAGDGTAVKHNKKKVAYSPAGAEATSSSHHRRRTSRGLHVPADDLKNSSPTRQPSFGGHAFIEEEDRGGCGSDHMSLDRSPSPQAGGGWSSPGLSPPYEETNGRSRSPGKRYGALNGGVTWATAKAKSDRVSRGYPRYQSQNEGFFSRHYRRISEGLPYFAHGGQEDRFAKEKLGRGRSLGRFSVAELPRRLGLLLSRRRKYVALAITLLFALLLWFQKPLTYWYRRTSFLGGGSKFVIILGANQGGGVMEWKGPREWAIERDSVKNKKKYAANWGYELEIVDMSTKKRYAHEWRESWEKVDVVRNSMKKYPNAEWFWWLDLNTFIMEPTYSLQRHIFNNLEQNTYRDINLYNPLHIQHPPNGTSGDLNAPQYANYLDPETLSPVGDGDPNSINLIIPQDCSGFNLGSFFVKRSSWTDRILDIWWDPVFYEQKHMEWEHKEQDALEYIYTNQPWIRSHVAFIPQRLINAFPNTACGEDRGLPAGGCNSLKNGDDPQECGIQGIHYQEKERDFLVNMAGCEWGRDCWGEMYNFRELSNRLNRSWWEKFKDWIRESWNRKREEKKTQANENEQTQKQK